MNYKAEIIFNGEDFYDVYVRIGNFSTKEEAVAFADQPRIRLSFKQGYLWLYWPVGQFDEKGEFQESDKNFKILADKDIEVFRLKDEAIAAFNAGSHGINSEDFVETDILISQFQVSVGFAMALSRSLMVSSKRKRRSCLCLKGKDLRRSHFAKKVPNPSAPSKPDSLGQSNF